MKIEMWPLAKVKPYEKNPRKNEGAIDAVAKSIQEFGFRVPIVVDGDGVVIAGHTRLKAAEKLGLEKVPVHVARELSPDKVRALRIADNKLHELSSWDMELLPIELGDLQSADFDLSLLGFSEEDLSALMAPAGNDGLTDPDDVPGPPDAATTVPGDIWVLGNHRLMCGDSSKPADLDRLLGGQQIHLVNTDPPYNVKVEPRSNNAIVAGLSSFALPGKADQHDQQSADLNRYPEKSRATHKKLRAKDRPLMNDFMTDEAFDMLLDAWFGNIARVLIPGGGFYIWGGYANCGNYPPVLKRHELYFAQAVIWVKEHPVLTRKDFMGNHEWCFYGWKEGAAHRFFGPANVPDVWSIKKVNPQSMVHLTEKPVELARRAIEFSSRPGEHVLDLFGGSGSTLIGAEMTGRRAFLMELDALYCDVIVLRWEKFTGRKAERLGSNAVAEEKAATRVAAKGKA
jgi:DNA modification methylase